MESLIKPTLALIRADVGLKGKGRLRGRQKCIQADARWRQEVFYMPPTAVICSTSTHVARHLPHSKREGAPVTGIVYGRNCHSCSTPLGSAVTFSHAAAGYAGGAAATSESNMSVDVAGDTISTEPMVVFALPVFTQ